MATLAKLRTLQVGYKPAVMPPMWGLCLRRRLKLVSLFRTPKCLMQYIR